ncbi:hypothetical protein GCM10009599_16440 [Luteococcus peritonei]
MAQKPEWHVRIALKCHQSKAVTPLPTACCSATLPTRVQGPRGPVHGRAVPASAAVPVLVIG